MPAPPVAADKRFERFGSVGGTPGHVFGSVLFYTETPLGSKVNEWNLIAIHDNYADAGENVAAYMQGRAYGRGATWGLCSEAADMSFGTKGASMVGGEFDVWTCGASTGNRVGVHAVVGDAKLIHGGSAYVGPCEAEHGFLSSNNGHANARWRHGLAVRHWNRTGVSVEGDGGDFGVRFTGTMTVACDFTALEKVQAVIRLRDSQWISLDATDSVLFGYQLGRVKVTMCGKPVLELDINTGDLFLKGEVRKL